MSKEELIDAYAKGRISRRTFAKGIAALGGALAAGIVLEASAGAQAKKAPAKKVPGKKAAKGGPPAGVGKPTTTTTTLAL